MVDVLLHLANEHKLLDVGAIVAKEPNIPKVDVVSKLAREAGHSLNSHFKCVKCDLQLNMSRSIAYHESTLHMKCLGGKAIVPKVSLHTKPEHGAN